MGFHEKTVGGKIGGERAISSVEFYDPCRNDGGRR